MASSSSTLRSNSPLKENPGPCSSYRRLHAGISAKAEVVPDRRPELMSEQCPEKESKEEAVIQSLLSWDSRLTTCSAIAKHEVRPGLSMPNKFTSPGTPWVFMPWIMKSALGSPGPDTCTHKHISGCTIGKTRSTLLLAGNIAALLQYACTACMQSTQRRPACNTRPSNLAMQLPQLSRPTLGRMPAKLASRLPSGKPGQ